MELKPATPNERRQYYREEWDVKNVPDFIRNTLIQREFGFDHIGRGPNDRYRVFRNSDDLRKFMRVRTPFAAYSSVAFYNNPKRRGGWIKAELVFDVDAKDIPIRTCGCDNVCEICLNQAKDIVMGLLDTLQGDLGLKNINVVYSGRGYHIRVLDDAVMAMDSDVRSQIVKYLVGADVPRSEYSSHGMKYNLEHFTIPFGYPQVFTHRVKQALLNLTPDTEIDDVRDLICKVVNQYLIAYNNNESIRPYLCHYPVTAKNIHLSIYFYDKSHDTLPSPFISRVDCKRGKIHYYMLNDDEVSRVVQTEDFEEADEDFQQPHDCIDY